MVRPAAENSVAVLFSAHEINPLLDALDKVLYLGGGRGAMARGRGDHRAGALPPLRL